MTTTLTPGRGPAAHLPSSTPRETVWALGRYETLRLARHPLFVVATLLFVLVVVTTPFSEYATQAYLAQTGETETNLDWPVAPAFLLGLGGLIAMNRLTSSSDRAGDVLHAAPVEEPRRTLALCLACLLPALTAAAGAGYVLVFWAIDPPTASVSWSDFTEAERVAVMAQGVLAALGGPLLGVLVGRWWRWPTAAAVTCVVLIGWSVLSSLVPDDDNVLLTLNHMAAPFTLVAANFADSTWVLGGNHFWRVAYLVGLCLLAALGAIAHGTQGEQRRRMARVVAAVAVLTVVALVASVVFGQSGHPGYWDPRWPVG